MNDERRLIDQTWKESVDAKLTDGANKFETLVAGQKSIAEDLADNSAKTNEIGGKLDQHITTSRETSAAIAKQLSEHVTEYQKFTKLMTPVASSVEAMQTGMVYFGKFGSGCAWVAKWFRRTVVWITPIGAAAIALWEFFTGGWHIK